MLAAGVTLLDTANLEDAKEGFDAAARLGQVAGLRYAQAMAAIGLGAALTGLGRLDEARRQTELGLDQAREAGYGILEGKALTGLARLEQRCGHVAKASLLAQSALANHVSTGYRIGAAETLMLLAELGTDPLIAKAARLEADQIHVSIGSLSTDGLTEWEDAIKSDAR